VEREAPDRYERLIVMNTIIATGRFPLGDGFLAWRAWVNANPDLAVGRLMRRACPHLSEAEAAAYDAPFPSVEYKAGARRFPNLVCDRPDADGAEVSRRAARWWRYEWRMHSLRQVIHGCPDPQELAQAGHFVQEHGEVVARAALASFSEDDGSRSHPFLRYNPGPNQRGAPDSTAAASRGDAPRQRPRRVHSGEHGP
jgi:hypothetical protein